jgi:adenosylcobinamide-phosphate synthase
MFECALIIILSFTLDLLLGDPVYRYHPVRIIGNSIAFFEGILFRWKQNTLLGGVILTLIIVILFPLIYVLIFLLLETNLSVYISYIFSVYIVYSCISLKDLLKHANKVVSELNYSLDRGRKAVQMIVGRNAELLDKEGIIKATVECIAESFVDGILAPAFWFVAGGFIGILVGIEPVIVATIFVITQRSVNTIDSMIGYKNAKYINFGTFGAIFDDILNFIPARVSIFIIAIASAILRLDYCNCLKIGLRDRLNHASPNSAHSEAAVAGALGIQLGGPTTYIHGTVDKPFLGDKINKIKLLDILVTGKLIKTASVVSIIIGCIILLAG